MDNKTALSFNTICNFIRDLNASFGSKQKSLMLYGHLIEKTGLIHIEPVKKHITLFKQFVETNEEAILNRDKKKMKTMRISYSDKVAIDLEAIFKLCDREEESILWNHLLTISAILNPESQAKQILKELQSKASSGENKEGDFLQNIMGKITEQVSSSSTDGQDPNPMAMIGSLMSSGVFSELFQTFSNGLGDDAAGGGGMDMSKLMGTMQNMMGELNKMMKETAPSPKDSPTLPVD